jgi:hypothetical protein
MRSPLIMCALLAAACGRPNTTPRAQLHRDQAALVPRHGIVLVEMGGTLPFYTTTIIVDADARTISADDVVEGWQPRRAVKLTRALSADALDELMSLAERTWSGPQVDQGHPTDCWSLLIVADGDDTFELATESFERGLPAQLRDQLREVTSLRPVQR